ncbi:MAG: hypothetical protein H6819_06820 [Phycisphaerales bacterium]|nr:hypothetical protein [Phycisphaerales bacterium]MCB9855293.1 hypothetical protein [Phycisphaerales bacterium]MCB9862886.1 hypothetical protein [Phycisphaerales bacterium]
MNKNDDDPLQEFWFRRSWLEILIRLLEELLVRQPAEPDPPPDKEPADSDPKIAGVTLSKFKRQPFLDVSRGILRDGKGGPVMGPKVLQGAEKSVLAHLVINGELSALDVIALQAQDGTGTFRVRKRNARGTISKVRSAIKGMGLEIANKNEARGAVEWVLHRQSPSRVSFSIDCAHELAIRADQELAAGNPVAALAIAKEAIDIDVLVQLAHEACCRAAMLIGSENGVAGDTVKKSISFLRKRESQVNRAIEIQRRSLSDLDDDDDRADLEVRGNHLTNELNRIATIIATVIKQFGDPQWHMSPKDRRANEAIEKLRELRLSVDEALLNPISESILGHPKVERLRRAVEAEIRRRGCDDPTEARKLVNACVMQKALHPGFQARIRLVCEHAKHAVREDLGLSREKGGHLRDVTALRGAKQTFYAEHGHDPSEHEVAEILGWTVEKVRETENASRIENTGDLDTGGHGRGRTKKRHSDEDLDWPDDENGDGGNDDDDDDDMPGIVAKW